MLRMRYMIFHLCDKYARNARKARNARIFCNFLHKKWEITKNITFLMIFGNFSRFFMFFCIYRWIFLTMQKSEKCDMREMRNHKNARNNVIREILFLAINRMWEICKKCKKIEKFKKCDNYRTCFTYCVCLCCISFYVHYNKVTAHA